MKTFLLFYFKNKLSTVFKKKFVCVERRIVKNLFEKKLSSQILLCSGAAGGNSSQCGSGLNFVVVDEPPQNSV